MKIPLPKMTPKQKFILFAIVAFISVAVIMMYRAFTVEERAQGQGSVKVDVGASSNSTPVKDSKATSDTEAQRQLRAIKEYERKKRLSEESKDSYMDTPELTPKIEKVVDEESIEKEKSNDILSIEDLVKDMASEQEEEQKKREPKQNVIEQLTEKKRINDEAVNIDFDRASYMNSLRNINSKLPNYNSQDIALSQPVAASVREYGSPLPTQQNQLSAQRNQIANEDGIDTLAKDTLNKRDKQLDEFLRSSGLKQNNDPSTVQNAIAQNKPDSSEEDYPYKEVKTVGDTIYAINRLPINTDGAPIVQLTTVSPGDTNNAVLSGNFTKMGDSVVLRFTTYSKKGESYPINAIAIDPQTWESMLADDVDKHYWERYGGVILASIIQGYSQTLQNVTVSDTNAGQRETRQRVSSFNDRLMVGFGRAGAALAPHFLQNANRESTVYLYKDRPVAVLFLDNFKVPITD